MQYVFTLHLWHTIGEGDGFGERFIVRLGELSGQNPVPPPEMRPVKGLRITYPFREMPAAVAGALLTNWVNEPSNQDQERFALGLIRIVAWEGFQQREYNLAQTLDAMSAEFPKVAHTVWTLCWAENFRVGLDALLKSIHDHCQRLGQTE